MVINPRDGVILSLSSYAPWHMAQQQVPPVTVLPKLKAYSDITFLQWYGSHGSDNREAAQNISASIIPPGVRLTIRKLFD